MSAHDVAVSGHPIRHRLFVRTSLPRRWTFTTSRAFVLWTTAAAILASLLVLAGCQSSTQQLVGPSGAKCEIWAPAGR